MKYLIALSIFVSSYAYSADTRCGWLENPTSANVWLSDKDGSWAISIQGGYSVDDESMALAFLGMENKDNFVRTNRNGGFSCACLVVDVKTDDGSISKIYKAEQLLLKQCLEDIAITPVIPLPFK
ncbi:Protein of unknown function [Rheinheimera pacifica]|uniref:DUF4087 domain-containing protein n=1 Tax=Rheinheimera pacifica TaxID=173990 RepID=A0A1H6LJV3_9GAMM|nr:DUF4087 domain-containing protein [Rheinheimera pacifica]SEH85075.1 Protein of unknown function [Rheinheimera pacifica]